MKNNLENIAVFLVSILSLLIIFLILQYNMIKDDNTIENISYLNTTHKKNKETTKEYLNQMENYSDTDIQVDPTKEDHMNNVKVTSELTKSNLQDAIEDTSKTSYIKNIQAYSEHNAKEINVTTSLPKKNNITKQVKEIKKIGDTPDNIVGDVVVSTPLQAKETNDIIDDKIRIAIDSIVDDL